jgi:DNA-binding MarR family transcriptional regulator
MRDYIEIANTMDRIIHKYIRNEDIKRIYGIESLLTRKEIHTIEYIGEHPGINLKFLAEMQGVTKGAASQMISRLVKKGYIQRKDSPSSGAEISLYLTEKGDAAYAGHQEYHKHIGKIWRKLLENMSEETINEMEEFLGSFEKILDQEYENKGE